MQYIDGRDGLAAVKARGHEAGWSGLPSSSNPHTPGSDEHETWRIGHFEGQCAAMDDGSLPPL